MPSRASSLEAHALFAGDAARGLAPVGDAELRQLRVFCMVVAAGGLSAATAELQADLSTISRQFKELEARVGTRLAQRGRGGFALTPAGQQLHQVALRLFGALQSFRDDVAGLAQPPGPLLRLGVVDALLTAPLAPLPRALAACVEALPGLRVQLTTLRPIEIERRILAGELEAGVIAAHAPAAGLVHQRLYAEPNSVYVGPGHPWHGRRGDNVTEEDLATVEWVVDPYSVDLPQPAMAVAMRGTTHADSIEGVALLVASGRYAGLLPDHLVQGCAALAGLHRVRPERFSYSQDIVLTSRQGKADAVLRVLSRQLALATAAAPAAKPAARRR
ncbi:MAG TPA: LysR family transcriptional regulator [Ideonella sp.]|jgi:DNA-binding transcriptional LysR family regulator|nr:LysR family transcriptional regulator [Ideonella sp.]